MGHRPDISPVWLIFAAAQRRLHRKMAVFQDFQGMRAAMKKRPADEPGAFKSLISRCVRPPYDADRWRKGW